jgi:hypothetical protein
VHTDEPAALRWIDSNAASERAWVLLLLNRVDEGDVDYTLRFNFSTVGACATTTKKDNPATPKSRTFREGCGYIIIFLCSSLVLSSLIDGLSVCCAFAASLGLFVCVCVPFFVCRRCRTRRTW